MTEKQRVAIDLPAGKLTVDGKTRGIKAGEIIPTKKDHFNYEIKLWEFTTEDGQGVETNSDGCLFVIEPYSSTHAMKIVKEGYKSQRCVVKGSGWYLATNFGNGSIEWVRVSADDENNGMVEMPVGCVDCWIADENGMEVVDISEPRFQPDFEVEQHEEDAQPSAFFWEVYHELIEGHEPRF